MDDKRFTAPQQTEEGLTNTQNVGLVQLSELRKRRAEAMNQSGGLSDGSRASTPRDG
jgi:hypothetical protein